MRCSVKGLSTTRNHIVALVSVCAATAGVARADVITSVSTNTNYAPPLNGSTNPYTGSTYDYTAGVLNVDDWNSFNSEIPGGARNATPVVLSAAIGSLQTSDGGTSPIGFSTAYENADNTGSSGSNISGQNLFYESTGEANNLVINGGIQNGNVAPLTLGLTGLSPTDTYNVYVYASSLYFFTSNSIAISDGAQTFYLGATTNNGLASFVQATTTTATTSALDANYVEFTGITDLSALAITLTNADGSTDAAALTAFQVDDLGSSAPEPASLGLLAFAGLGLLHRRRRLA